MNLSELLAAYGDDKVQFQNLDQCMKSIDYSQKKGTTITFGTEMTSDLKGTTKLGLVVWLDRDAVKEIIAKSKESTT